MKTKKIKSHKRDFLFFFLLKHVWHRFFVALQDDLMRIFGGEQIGKLMNFFNFPEDQPLSHSMVSKAIEQAQVKVEGFNFDIRKHLVEFDDVLNKQREIIYALRRKMVAASEGNADDFRETIFDIFKQEIAGIVGSYAAMKDQYTEEELDVFKKDLNLLLPDSIGNIDSVIKKRGFGELEEYLGKKVEDYFKTREKEVGQDLWFDVIRTILLSTIDQFWTQHLTGIEDLREGINLRGYAQLDP